MRVQVVIEEGEGIPLAVHELFVVGRILGGAPGGVPRPPRGPHPDLGLLTVTAFHPGRRSEGQLGALARPAPKAERTVGCGCPSMPRERLRGVAIGLSRGAAERL